MLNVDAENMSVECVDVSDELVETLFDYVKAGDLVKISGLVQNFGVKILSTRDEWGYTIAHWASLYGNVDLIQYLLRHNIAIDLSCFGTQGPKPIHWACREGHSSIVAILLHANVDVNTRDLKGLTPLMIACIYGRINTCIFLLGMGVEHSLVDSNGDTAAHWAAFKGHADIIRVLINAGANLEKMDNCGSTPLHLACIYGHVNCVNVLCLLRKLNLEERDKNGKTPLMLAENHNNHEIVKLLQEEIKKRNRYNSLRLDAEMWEAFCRGFDRKNSKGPVLLFVGSVLLWCYPMYFLKYVPLTWNSLKIVHYCFMNWNILMWSSWFLSMIRDPGYLPVNTENYAHIIRGIPLNEKKALNSIPFSQLCHTCRCIRPLRSKHCRRCDRCIAYFDHHCSFINNCVGIKNRSWFFVFLLSLALNSSFSVYFNIYCIRAVGYEGFLLLSLILSLILMCFSWVRTAIAFLHACMNLTTNEMLNYKRYPYLRNRGGKYFNWFSRGPIYNLFEFFIFHRKVKKAVDRFA